MKHFWLNKKQNDKLIIFFNGWAMNEQAVKHLDCGKYDVIMFYDYRTLDTKNIDFSGYKNKFLIAWSMGIFISNFFFKLIKNTDVNIAVNGTFYPVNDKFGIYEKIYNLTINNFNEYSCKKFIKNMSLQQNFNFVQDRTVPELKEELIAIKNYTNIFSSSITFNKALISNKDKIISTQNQLNFWQSETNVVIKQINSGHYPFYNFLTWEEIINV